EGDVELAPGGAERGGHGVAELTRGDAPAGGLLVDLLPVLVGAGQEQHLETVLAPEAPEHVGEDGRVGVPDVRVAVRVVDRGREEAPPALRRGRAHRRPPGCPTVTNAAPLLRPAPLPWRLPPPRLARRRRAGPRSAP